MKDQVLFSEFFKDLIGKGIGPRCAGFSLPHPFFESSPLDQDDAVQPKEREFLVSHPVPNRSHTDTEYRGYLIRLEGESRAEIERPSILGTLRSLSQLRFLPVYRTIFRMDGQGGHLP